MKNHLLLICSILTLFVGCSPKKVEEKYFHLPYVYNSKVSGSTHKQFFKVDFLVEDFPVFMGKYKFSDTIDINPLKMDTSFLKDFKSEYEYRNIVDSLEVNGFELKTDYAQTVYHNRYSDTIMGAYYPVYFINSTRTNKVFLGKDSYAFGIQEAEDTSEYPRWRPIESRGWDFCGNGNWALVVKPGEFVVVLMKKYEGEYLTNLRVRFALGPNVYVSPPFAGRINKNQFYFHKDSNLKSTNGNYSFSVFYGAVPAEQKEVE